MMPEDSTETITCIIIEDNAMVTSVLQTYLEAFKYTVVDTVSKGKRARASIETHKPDFVLLDLNLDDMSGMSLLALIHEEHPDLAVVIVSGQDDATTKEVAKSLGACGFITKPVSLSESMNTLNEALEEHIAAYI